MYLVTDKPQLNDTYLEHFGIKGMKWGQRKKSSKDSSTKKSMSTKKKVAIGVGVAAGVAAVAYMMTRRGKVPVKHVMGTPQGFKSPNPGVGRTFIPDDKGGFVKGRDGKPSSFTKNDASKLRSMAEADRARQAASNGKRAANDISQSEWKKRVSDVRKDIADANTEQDRWMRRQGLGAQLNRKTTDVDMGDIKDVRRAWTDPNHVWQL